MMIKKVAKIISILLFISFVVLVNEIANNYLQFTEDSDRLYFSSNCRIKTIDGLSISDHITYETYPLETEYYFDQVIGRNSKGDFIIGYRGRRWYDHFTCFPIIGCLSRPEVTNECKLIKQ